MATWRHNAKTKTDTNEDPTNNQFFSNETVGNLSNALIREGIQNNLDEAKSSNQPVCVRIFLSGTKYAIHPAQYLPYFNDLLPHLNAEGNGILKSDLPSFRDPMPYLIFEDFSTKGLEGDPLEYSFTQTREKNKPHNFYFFWRAYGISGKLGGKMGSWGVGKSVFPASSGINCYLALTIRESDKNAYLIGQSVLKTHNLTDSPAECGYSPYGYYANFDKDGFGIPEDSEKSINEVANLFKVKRRFGITEREQNTGLSIIIPFPKNDLSINSLVYSTIQQFFYPIILGKLEVELVEEDTSVVLRKNTIRAELNRIDLKNTPGLTVELKDNLLSLFNFTDWILAQETSSFVNLQFESPERAFEWRKKELFKDINLENLQKLFDSGAPIAFNIPVKFQPESKQAELRYFKAFLQKDDLLKAPENYFIREYLNIIGVKSLRKKGVRGVVILSDKDLVTFFGQAEGPAHTGWHKANFRSKYESSEQCISFVQNSLERLYSYLLMPSEGLDKELLKEFFYVETAEEKNSKGRPGKKDEKKPKPVPPIPPPSKPRRYSIDQIAGGFKITSNPDSDFEEEELLVKVAYDRFDGNPFNKYSEFDFNIKKLAVESSKVQSIKIDKNTIQFEPTEKDFEIKVTGFDSRRDLVIDVK